MGYFFRTNFNAHFNMNMYVTLSSTCFGPWHAHLQEEQLHKHSIWYLRSPKWLYTKPVESRLKARNMSRMVMWHTCVIELSIKVGWRNKPILWSTVEKTSNLIQSYSNLHVNTLYRISQVRGFNTLCEYSNLAFITIVPLKGLKSSNIW